MSTHSRSEAGIVLVVTAIGIMAFAMLVGLVIDSGLLEYRKLTLKKAATTSSLRLSQLYYDGAADEAAAVAAARETARLNLVYSGLSSTEASDAATAMVFTPDAAAGRVTASVDSSERMYFSNVMKGDPFRAVRSDSAASYARRDTNRQHYRHIYIVFSVFASMTGPFQTTADVEIPPPHSTANDGSKSAVGTQGVIDLLNKLDGQYVSLVGFGTATETLTDELPINDEPSAIDPTMSNRDYAKEQAQKLLNLNYGAEMAPALREVYKKLQKLSAAEREESLVLVISDGIIFNSNLFGFGINLGSEFGFGGGGGGGGGSCSFEPALAMKAANDIRTLGVTVSTIGLYATGVEMKGEGIILQIIKEILDQMALHGQQFMEALASASDFGVPCVPKGNPEVFPNDIRIGRYFAPRTNRDLAVFLDEATSRREFVVKLPRRVN